MEPLRQNSKQLHHEFQVLRTSSQRADEHNQQRIEDTRLLLSDFQAEIGKTHQQLESEVRRNDSVVASLSQVYPSR